MGGLTCVNISNLNFFLKNTILAYLLTFWCRLLKSECRGNWEKLPGERGLWVGEAGRNCRGNRNTAAAVRTNTARR